MKTESQKWIGALFDTLIGIIGPIVAGILFGAFLLWLWRMVT
jgi:uncharacterized membrane protein YeaQ/YmgE (transglycosylase-associated protein family)